MALAFGVHTQFAIAAEDSPTRTAAPAASTLQSAGTETSPAPDSRWPQLVGAQYTYVLQWQSRLDSPYSGPLSLHPDGDRQPTHTIGAYTGWGPTEFAQLYFDTEKFMGAGDSGATGLGGLTNGDVVREGATSLKKNFYIARVYARFMLPLGDGVTRVERNQDQLPGTEAATRLELKVGRMAASDDFDKNRYAGGTRTEFMNWSLWNNTAWDFAANTRGYTDGVVLGYVSPRWSLKYGIYRMPLFANGQSLEASLRTARGENLELTLSQMPTGTIVRLLAYRNTARMGNYREALAIAAVAVSRADIVGTDQNGRHKTGFGINVEQPLADDGETGLFARLGWNDGQTESFAFTEVDRLVSAGAQLSGIHWYRAGDRFGAALAVEGLSGAHRDYLAAGGCGFVLCDGRLNYGHEEILETYYRVQLVDSVGRLPLRLQLSPDFQYIRNPAYNQDRGPVRFWGLRLHLEY